MKLSWAILLILCSCTVRYVLLWPHCKDDENKAQTVYQFPNTAIVNCHGLSGLEQHGFIILQFWRVEVQHGCHWAKIKGEDRAVSPVLPQGKICFLIVPASGGCLDFSLVTPPSLKPATLSQVSFIQYHFDTVSCLLPPILRSLVITLDPPR